MIEHHILKYEDNFLIEDIVYMIEKLMLVNDESLSAHYKNQSINYDQFLNFFSSEQSNSLILRLFFLKLVFSLRQ